MSKIGSRSCVRFPFVYAITAHNISKVYAIDRFINYQVCCQSGPCYHKYLTTHNIFDMVFGIQSSFLFVIKQMRAGDEIYLSSMERLIAEYRPADFQLNKVSCKKKYTRKLFNGKIFLIIIA